MRQTLNIGAGVIAKNAAERLERCLRFLAHDPGNVNLLADAADLCLSLNKTGEARELVQRGLAANANAPSFRYRLACVTRAEGNWEETVTLSRELLDQGQDAPAIRYNLGIALMMSGQHAQAKEQLFAIDEEAAFPNLPYYRVRTLHHLGELDEAAKAAESHLALHPQDAAMAGALSTLCVDRENFDAARHWAALSLKGNVDNVDALLTDGLIALSEEQGEKADAAFKRAIELQPANARAWAGRAMSHLFALDIKAAQADFEQALKYMPAHIGTWQALAWCQILQDDLAGAQQSLTQALSLDRNFGETHGGLAVLAALRGNWEEAERSTTVALKLDPNAFAGRFAQTLLLQHRGKGEVAQVLLRRMLTNHAVPGGGSLIEMIGRSTQRHRQGKF